MRPVPGSMTVVVVATYGTVAGARATVRSVLASRRTPCLVVDVDGAYRAVTDEPVVPLGEVVAALGLAAEATVAAATLDPDELIFYAGVLGATHAQSAGAEGVVVLGAGVLVLDDLDDLGALGTGAGGALVAAYTDPAGARLRASSGPGVVRRAVGTGLLVVDQPDAAPLYSRSAYTLHTVEQTELLRGLAADWRTARTALDGFAVAVGATVAGEPRVISPWRAIGPTSVDQDGRLCVDGARVCLVDLTALDARRPWTLDAGTDVPPRVLLSAHPALAEVVRAEAERRLADESPSSTSAEPQPARTRWDAILRSEARRTQLTQGDVPDLLGLGVGEDLATWALRLVPDGHPRPVARYLQAVRSARLDLQRSHRQVPGPGSESLARWALKSGVGKPAFDADLLARAAAATLAAQPGADSSTPASAEETLSPGVNLVGYLTGEMGLGESARLVDDALQQAGVPTSTYDVGWQVESRRGATYRQSDPVLRRTTVVCMNGAETAAAAHRLERFTRHTRVIGMWYDELERLAPRHEAGFEHVQEVWAATDFVRDAIARSAPDDVVVRTVTPPLPQALGEPGVVPPAFGIPADRPWFLFTFDFFSSAERKNPYGLVDAFIRAFDDRPADERPLLVLKTINADRCPGDAERLRVQIAGRPDVLHLDTYLDHDVRHVLVANCTAYVSLHKAEGLGLTVAEAMAWGRPVITTAYGGVTQFCTDQNVFLVDWDYGHVEQAHGPYVMGTPWAEPDLDRAAVLMRLVLDQPEQAAAIGAQAARDIRDLHNSDVSGARMREALDEGDARWQAAHATEQAPERGPLRGRLGSALVRRARR